MLIPYGKRTKACSGAKKVCGHSKCQLLSVCELCQLWGLWKDGLYFISFVSSEWSVFNKDLMRKLNMSWTETRRRRFQVCVFLTTWADWFNLHCLLKSSTTTFFHILLMSIIMAISLKLHLQNCKKVSYQSYQHQFSTHPVKIQNNAHFCFQNTKQGFRRRASHIPAQISLKEATHIQQIKGQNSLEQ